MDQKYFHGDFTPDELANYLVTYFNRGNFDVQKFGNKQKIIVQIKTSRIRSSGGSTAISILFQKAEDGVSVLVGQQAWLGLIASLAYTALAVVRNPLTFLGRIDDLAQDIESIQLTEEIWKTVEMYTHARGTGFALTEKLRRISCKYCETANPPGHSSCIACGAPMGGSSLSTCKQCGYILTRNEKMCPNCNAITN